MPLHLTGIATPDEPERPEQPDDLHSVAGKRGGDGVRHGDCLPCALLDSFSAVHGNAIRNYSSDAVAPRECRVTATDNVSLVQCDNALIERNSRPCYHTADPSEKRKEIADASPHTARGAGLVTGDTFAPRNSGGNPAPATGGSAINPGGDRGGAHDAAPERTLAVTCPVCLGRGTNAHFPWLPCGICFGSGEERCA